MMARLKRCPYFTGVMKDTIMIIVLCISAGICTIIDFVVHLSRP